MRGKLWRKALAACLALTMVSGNVPALPFSQMFNTSLATANADIDTFTTSFRLGSKNYKYVKKTGQSYTFLLSDVLVALDIEGTPDDVVITDMDYPMCLLHFPVLGLYVYASTESIMKKALKQVGLHKFAMERVETDEGDIVRIDRNGDITRSEFEPKLYRSKYMSWYDDSSYYNIHEEMLLAYCGCYGVDS